MALTVVQTTHPGFDHRNGRYADGQLLNAQADQDSHGIRVTGQAAADAGPFAFSISGLHGHINQAQHGRMQTINTGCQFRMAAINRQSVLGQVIGADGEEVHFLGKMIRQQGR